MAITRRNHEPQTTLLRLSLPEAELEQSFSPKPADILLVPCASAVSFLAVGLAAASAIGVFDSGFLGLSSLLGSVVLWVGAITRSLTRFRYLQELVWHGLTHHRR